MTPAEPQQPEPAAPAPDPGALLAELDRLQQEEWQANLASLEGVEISQ